MTTYWRLHGTHSSLVLQAAPDHAIDQAPIWRYWGARLSADAIPACDWHTGQTRAPSSLDVPIAPSILPGQGFGASASPAIVLMRDGKALLFAATQCQVQQPSSQALSIQLIDDINGAEIKLLIQLDAHDVLTTSTCITHIPSTGASHATLQVLRLSGFNAYLPHSINRIHSFHGQWSNEFQWQSHDMQHSQWRQVNTTGRTSHQAFPGALMTSATTDHHQGAGYAAHQAWSGNFYQQIDTLDDGTRQWQLGVELAVGEINLELGQHWQSPTVLASYSPFGHNGLMQNFHSAMRSRLQWPTANMPPRPVHLNTWEAVYFDHRLDDLQDLASAAAQVGVERFILDDGWFHRRNDDTKALGDWWPDAQKYPNGLLPLAQHVVKLGMQFGLWVEPEMVNPDSELYRLHPDWALQVQGRPVQTWRNQLVLNLALPEVREYLFQLLSRLLSSLPIQYLKWDMNRDLTQAVDTQGQPRYAAYVDGLYALLRKLRSHFPQVEIESCASGGGRMDAGILPYTHRFWTSDNNDAQSRVRIQRGALQFFPPEVLGAHIGPAPYHTTGRFQDVAFRAGVALPLHFGLELDVRYLREDELHEIRQWVDLYKSLRHLLHGQHTWLGEVGDHVLWQAHGSTSDMVVFVTRYAPTQNRQTPPLLLPMLNPSCMYRISQIDPLTESVANAGVESALHRQLRGGDSIAVHGDWLAKSGMPLPRMGAECVHIYRFTAINV